MKKLFFRLVLLVAATAMITTTACKKKNKDADIKAGIETALKADPALASVVADVKDGVVTLSGALADDATKNKVLDLVKGIKGVDAEKISNNLTVTPPAPIVPEVTNADALTKAINDAVKDFPGVKTDFKDGILTLTGEVAKDKLKKLMMGLTALKSMGVKQIISKDLVKK